MAIKDFTERFRKMPLMSTADTLLSVGGINWGYIAVTGNNLVSKLVSSIGLGTGAENVVYFAVGVSGVVSFAGLFMD